MPSKTEYEIEIDGTKYKWVHNSCFCLGHCGSDEFYVNGEEYGSYDNQELCWFITALIEKVKANDIGKGNDAPAGGSDL